MRYSPPTGSDAALETAPAAPTSLVRFVRLARLHPSPPINLWVEAHFDCEDCDLLAISGLKCAPIARILFRRDVRVHLTVESWGL